jgi:hypothetical protein
MWVRIPVMTISRKISKVENENFNHFRQSVQNGKNFVHFYIARILTKTNKN